MPPPTLKLPKRPARGGAVDDPRSPARKPIRGQSQLSKQAASWRGDGKSPAAAAPGSAAGRPAGKPQRFASEPGDPAASQTRPTRRDFPANSQTAAAETPPRQRQHGTAERQPPLTVADPVAEGGRDRFAGGHTATERPDKPARKSYPPRGIARSTGVRAAPPAAQRPESDSATAPASAPSRPAASPRPDPSPARRDRRTATPAAARTVSPVAQAPDATTSAPRGLPKESPRLAKLVSQMAQCSRREADEWIENGWVSVDGVVVNRLGARVNPKATIRIKESANRQPAETVTIILNRPRKAEDGAGEDGRQAIATLIRADNRWSEDHTSFTFQASHLRGLTTAGKLDDDEGGMLALTQEGSVARRLTGGDSRLEKEYHVRVEGELAADGLELLRHGLSLDNVKLPRAQVSWLSEQQMRFVLHDGRKGQIARMCELVGLQVTDIKRVRIGSVSLGKLPPGQWRYLREDERF